MDVNGQELKTCKHCGNGVWMTSSLMECPYCGKTDFIEYGSNVKVNIKPNYKKPKKEMFTDTEKLMFGLYPKGFKELLKLKVFGRK